MKAARLSGLSGDLFVTAPTFSGHKLLPILAPALTARLLMTIENEPKIRGDKLPRADLTSRHLPRHCWRGYLGAPPHRTGCA